MIVYDVGNVNQRQLNQPPLLHGLPLVLDDVRAWPRFGWLVHGASMWPVLRRGDRIAVEAVDHRWVTPGDILLFSQGRVVLAHRVIAIERTGSGARCFVCRGDTRRHSERVPAGDKPMLRVVRRERRGMSTRVDRGIYQQLGWLYVHVGSPWPWVRRAYGAWRQLRRLL